MPPDPATLTLLAIAAIGTGVSAASSAGAFTKSPPEIPVLADPAVKAAREAQLHAARGAKGNKATILTGVNEAAPTTQSATLLGQSGGGKKR